MNFRKLNFAVLLLTCLFLSSNALAYTELSLSGSVRNSTLNDDTYNNTVSITGGVSVYIMEMSALEFSYTLGSKKESYVRVGESEPEILRTVFEMYGLDFVLSFASKEDPFQPYLKVGAAQIKNQQYQTPAGFSEVHVATAEGTAPSAGIGFRVMLSKTFSIKVGLDSWYAPTASKDKKTLDYAGRVGVSWMF